MSDETLVKFGSPTLAGLKTGNILPASIKISRNCRNSCGT